MDDRQLTQGEAEAFLADCYLRDLERDNESYKHLVEAYQQKLAEQNSYIKIMEHVNIEREAKLHALEDTLELLERELNKLRIMEANGSAERPKRTNRKKR